MSDVTFKLDLPGLNVLMKSPEMQGIINDAAATLAAQRGADAQVESAHPISFIAIGSVRGTTKDNDLEKKMGGARI